MNLQKDDTTEKGIYHTLKDVMEERDDDGKQWFTQENTSNLLMNFVAAGWKNLLWLSTTNKDMMKFHDDKN